MRWKLFIITILFLFPCVADSDSGYWINDRTTDAWAWVDTSYKTPDYSLGDWGLSDLDYTIDGDFNWMPPIYDNGDIEFRLPLLLTIPIANNVDGHIYI